LDDEQRGNLKIADDSTPLADSMLSSDMNFGDSMVEDIPSKVGLPLAAQAPPAQDTPSPTQDLKDSELADQPVHIQPKQPLSSMTVAEASPIHEESSIDSIHSFPKKPELLLESIPSNQELPIVADINLNINKRQIVPRRQNSAASDQLNMFDKLASLDDIGTSVGRFLSIGFPPDARR
jgi:hypothetical protein